MAELSDKPLVTTSRRMQLEKKRRLLLIIVWTVLSINGLVMVVFLLNKSGIFDRKEYLPETQVNRASFFDDESEVEQVGEENIASFDDFRTDELNQDKWATWTNNEEITSLKQTGGKLLFSIVGGASEETGLALTTKALVEGDLEASVDLELAENWGSRFRFLFHSNVDEWPRRFGFSIKKGEQGAVIVEAVGKMDDEDCLFGSKSFGARQMLKLKIIRLQGNAVFMVGDTEIAEVEDENKIFQGKGRVTLALDSREPDFPSGEIAIDNFKLKLIR